MLLMEGAMLLMLIHGDRGYIRPPETLPKS